MWGEVPKAIGLSCSYFDIVIFGILLLLLLPLLLLLLLQSHSFRSKISRRRNTIRYFCQHILQWYLLNHNKKVSKCFSHLILITKGIKTKVYNTFFWSQWCVNWCHKMVSLKEHCFNPHQTGYELPFHEEDHNIYFEASLSIFTRLRPRLSGITWWKLWCQCRHLELFK